MSALIEAKGLGRTFGDIEAVKGVSFTVKRGDVLGFLGPNGAGKSTTMKMLSCFLEPSQGTALVAGFDVCEQSQEVRKRLGYLPENAPLYSEMQVGHFLRFVSEVRGIESAHRKSAIDSVVDRCSLGRVFSQKIETLSKGYRRRVGLAQALIHDPEILILDEPTDGLDPNQKHEVRSLINTMSDKCIILSTHILEEVDAVCNRAIIIANGSIVADDTPEGLRANARVRAGQLKVSVKADQVDEVERYLQNQAYCAALQLASSQSRAKFLVELKADTEFRSDELLAEALEKGWGLSELVDDSSSLDAVFREITSQQEMS